jgi:hypothetical protein
VQDIDFCGCAHFLSIPYLSGEHPEPDPDACSSLGRPEGDTQPMADGWRIASQPGMTLPDIPIPNPAAVQEKGTDGWTLLVNPDTAGAMAVNQTGALIWKLVDGRRTAEEIAAAVRNRFPDAPDNVTEDVRALLTKLAEEGFVGQEVSLKGAH